MKFSYTEAVVLSPDDGEPLLMFRPELTIRVSGRDGQSADYAALVDTGADQIVFPFAVAEELGIVVQPALGPNAETFSGGHLTLSFADIELAIHGDGEELRWPTRAYFDQNESARDFLILGHMGFLEFFTAIFHGGDFTLELEPNEHFPRID